MLNVIQIHVLCLFYFRPIYEHGWHKTILVPGKFVIFLKDPILTPPPPSITPPLFSSSFLLDHGVAI